MFKYSIAFVLPISLLAALSIFSTKLGGENHTTQQYRLDADKEITVAQDTNEAPVLPGDERSESSTERT